MGPFKSFQDIPTFTRDASYTIDVSWALLERTLADMDETNGLDLDPPYQRAHVWTEAQQISFVEFKLRLGAGSNQIRWNSAGWNRAGTKTLELVDGKQRLQAVRRFMRDEIPAFGKTVSEYEGSLRHFIYRFQFLINDLPTRAEVLQWYLDINTGGTVHTDEEIEKVRRLLSEETRA